MTSIADAYDFVDLCGLYDYTAEEHIVHTGDGYLLGLHRLCSKKGDETTRVKAGEGSLKKRVVYLHHGLLMNSEVWVCITERERCLPFMLVEKGYDVWLGNNRGNKCKPLKGILLLALFAYYVLTRANGWTRFQKVK